MREEILREQIQCLVDESRYHEALDRLAALRSSFKSGWNPGLKSEFFYLTSLCLYETGHYRQALLKIRVSSLLARDLSDHSSYAKIKTLHGWILCRMGKLAEAIQELTESYVYYSRVRDFRSALVPLGSLAQIHYVTGKLQRSIDVLELSTEYALKCRSEENIRVNKRNLSRVHMISGNLARADEIVDSISTDSKDKADLGQSLLMKGMLCIYQFRFNEGKNKIGRARALLDLSASHLSIAVCHEYLGLLEYNRGNYRKAREFYQKVLDMPEPTASAVAQTLRMLTDVYIAEGKFKKAASTAKKAENAISEIGERIELGALYRAYGQIHTHNGETATARDYFKKSIDLLKEIGARYELALSYFTCGRSESYSRDERTSFLHTARTLFDEMDVPKRVEQVDDAILDLKSSAIPNIIRSKSKDDLPVIIVVNREMKRIIAYAEEVSGSKLSVLLTGETGTGKDLLARYIHHKSGRTGKFVPVNAAAIPNEMIESELFGYKKGAFTGAIEDKPGRFELADSGTFYLNEIGDATPEFQAKLLEVLEAGQVWRLGESRARKVNFRLIAATNHDLAHLMSANLFRLDLYHRLNEVPIALPTLTDRPEDIPYLVRHFLTDSRHDIKTDGGNAETVERLTAILSLREYPGNVRELKSRVKELLIATGGNLTGMVDLALDNALPAEKERIEAVLKYTDWNRSRAAWILGVSEGTIRNRMKKLRLSRS